MYFMALIYYAYIIFRCDSHNNRRMRNAQKCAPRLWEAQPKQAICRKRKLSIMLFPNMDEKVSFLQNRLTVSLFKFFLFYALVYLFWLHNESFPKKI